MATRATHPEILKPEQVADLLIKPVLTNSVAGQLLSTINVSGKAYRIPRIVSDPSAGWVAEGQEIPVSENDLDELTVTPRKVAGLSIHSSELASDSNPNAGKVIGDGLSRDLARKIDAALFGNTITNGPSGLLSLSGIVAVTAATAATDVIVNAFIGATYAIEANRATVTNWAMHPNTAARLSSMKKATGSNEPLLGNDVTQPTKRTLFGTRIITTPDVAENIVWGIDQEHSQLIVWDGAEVEADKSVFFTSDRVAIRGKMRANFAFPYPQSIAKVTLPTS